MDLIQGARKELASHTSVTSLVGTSSDYLYWIFRWKPYVQVEGTGSRAIVLRRLGGWTTPNGHNNMSFPRLSMEILADAERSVDKNVLHPNGEERALDVFYAADPYLHLPQQGEHTWGGSVRVLGSERLTEPVLNIVPGSDHLATCIVEYGVRLG